MKISKAVLKNALEKIGEGSIYVAKILTPIVVSAMCGEVKKNVATGMMCFTKGTYDNCINTIVNGDDFSTTKSSMIQMVKKDQDESYYKAIMSIVNSDMFGTSKIDAISKIQED